LNRSNRQNFLTSFDHDFPFDEFPSALPLTDPNDKTAGKGLKSPVF